MKRSLLLPSLVAIFSLYCPSFTQAEDSHEGHDHSGHDHGSHSPAEVAPDDHAGHDHDNSNALILNDAAPSFFTANFYVIGTAGAFESGSEAGDFATSEHDPLGDAVVQGLDLNLDFYFNEALSAKVSGFGHEGEEEWEYELEEAKLEVILNDNLTITAGQFLNAFGSQNEKHLHAWDFVNSNLADARMLNEAELVTRGAGFTFSPSGKGSAGPLFTFEIGEANAHAHGEEEEEEGEAGEDHFHADEGGIEGNLLSLDVDVPFATDENLIFTGSFAIGENGFGRNTVLYGFGARKIFNGCFVDGYCSSHSLSGGALLLRGDFIGRQVNGAFESGTLGDFNDYGFSASALYGLSDDLTLGVRYGWVSDVDVAEIASRHRFSTAATTRFGPNNMVSARVQYDYNHSDDLASEHVAWLRFMVHLSNGQHSH